MKPTLFAIFALVVSTSTLAFAKQPCNYSYWVWQGGERVRVCCNQQGFCFTKYGVYNK
jgi:hypothetical protein